MRAGAASTESGELRGQVIGALAMTERRTGPKPKRIARGFFEIADCGLDKIKPELCNWLAEFRANRALKCNHKGIPSNAIAPS